MSLNLINKSTKVFLNRFKHSTAKRQENKFKGLGYSLEEYSEIKIKPIHFEGIKRKKLKKS